MTTRYGGAFAELRSLLSGGPPFDEVCPTELAVHYRARARRGIAARADVYVPARATGASVVLVHGGAFVVGSRRMRPVRYLAARLCASGIAVCAIDYRLIFRGGRLDEALEDVCDAVAFWRGYAGRFRLDAGAISLVGLSAGATLALLAAARCGSAVARLVCCFGLYEIDPLRGPVPSILPRLLFRTTDRAVWRARSPLGATQPAAPTLLLHGGDDRLVSVDQARRLAARREALGLPTRLVIYPGAPHGFFNVPTPVAAMAATELVEHVNAPPGPAAPRSRFSSRAGGRTAGAAPRARHARAR
jgi:acetyl esterase/lipase